MTGFIDGGIELTREIKAAPANVFKAWTAAESFAQWFGGEAVIVPLESLDYTAESGRAWSAQMVLPDGNTIDWTGEFIEVTDPSHITMTITDQPADEARAQLSIDITPSDTGTKFRMTQETPGFSDEQRLATIDGWQGFLDVLSEIAAEQ